MYADKYKQMDMRVRTHTHTQIPSQDITHTFALTNMHEFWPENQMIPDSPIAHLLKGNY